MKTEDSELKAVIQKFIIAFAKSDFKKFAQLLEKEQSNRTMDSSFLELISYGICNKESLDKFGKVIIDAFKNGWLFLV